MGKVYRKVYRSERGRIWGMNIGIISHNNKKELIENFCIAYKKILSKHTLYATGVTGRRIEEATNLKVNKFLPGSVGGDRQFMEMIEDNRMDVVIFFYNPSMAATEKRFFSVSLFPILIGENKCSYVFPIIATPS